MGYNWDYLDKNGYNNEIGFYKFRRQFGFIVNEGYSKFENILDIAGGSGRFALPLRSYSDNITVVDINSTATEILKQRDNKIEIINADFNQLEINKLFSLVVCIEGLGYFSDWDDFFSKINSLLTEDGRFIFTVVNPLSWRYFIRKLKHIKRKSTYYTDSRYTLPDLKALLLKHNFELVSIEGMYWIPLPVTSDSKLVLVFEFIEKVFRLRKWVSQSPWLLLSVKKKH